MASNGNAIPPLILPEWADRMNTTNREWVRLNDVCTEIVDCPHSTPTYTEYGDFFIARTQDFRDGMLDLSEAARVDHETFNKRTKRVTPSHGDLIYSREGAYHGIAAEIPKDTKVCLGQRTVLIRPDTTRSNFRFLRYWLSYDRVRGYVAGHRAGSAAPRINLPTIRGVPVALPSLPEQKAIASILGALDDKIELNRRMNATLEAMARALFQSWFVDFDPVRAKLDDRPPTGLDPETAALFPATFQDSPLGHIPQGWVAGRVGDMATFKRTAINPGNHPDEIFDHYSLPAFDNSRTPKTELGSAIMSNKYLVEPDSVLLSKLNPHIPRIWLPDLRDTHRPVCSTEFMVASAKQGVFREYLFSLFTSSAFDSIYGTLVTGTTGSHQRIRPESVLGMSIVVPTSQVIRAFTDVVKPLFDRISCNVEQSRTLATLRDSLLPKLLSGELSVASSTKSVEACV